MTNKKLATLATGLILTSLYAGHRLTTWDQGRTEDARKAAACAWMEPRILSTEYDGGLAILSELCWRKNTLKDLKQSAQAAKLSKAPKTKNRG